VNCTDPVYSDDRMCGGGAWHILLTASSTRVLHPSSLTQMASDEVACDICIALCGGVEYASRDHRCDGVDCAAADADPEYPKCGGASSVEFVNCDGSDPQYSGDLRCAGVLCGGAEQVEARVCTHEKTSLACQS